MRAGRRRNARRRAAARQWRRGQSQNPWVQCSYMKSYTLNGMRYLIRFAGFGCGFRFRFLFRVLFVLGIATTSSAQSGAVHVTRDKVDAALAKGGVLVTAPQVQVSGVRRET